MKKNDFIKEAYAILGITDLYDHSIETCLYMIEEETAVTRDHRMTGKSTAARIALSHFLINEKNKKIGIVANHRHAAKTHMEVIQEILSGFGVDHRYNSFDGRIDCGTNRIEIVPNNVQGIQYDIVYADEPATINEDRLSSVLGHQRDVKCIFTQSLETETTWHQMI